MTSQQNLKCQKHGKPIDNLCQICDILYCKDCFRKSKKMCHKCFLMMCTLRRNPAYLEPDIINLYDFYKRKVDNILGYDWKSGKLLYLKRGTLRQLAKKLKPAGRIDANFLYGNFYHQYSNICISDFVPVLGCNVDINVLFKERFPRYFDFSQVRDFELLYEQISYDYNNEFRGWCIFMTPNRSVYFYMELDMTRGCTTCDGGTDSTVKIRYSDSLPLLISFCLKMEQINFILSN